MFCCKRFCKVIKMLAIHNMDKLIYMVTLVANAFAKLSKCQQFTTYILCVSITSGLQTLLQSYQNVSNSQHGQIDLYGNLSCKRFCKVIKMLAIHNLQLLRLHIKVVANAFAKLSKCQQFTTSLVQVSMHVRLQTLLQSYQNVSNSQHWSFNLS